jgi:hypothetical protein
MLQFLTIEVNKKIGIRRSEERPVAKMISEDKKKNRKLVLLVHGKQK